MSQNIKLKYEREFSASLVGCNLVPWLHTYRKNIPWTQADLRTGY
jgi:hypothetical protein